MLLTSPLLNFSSSLKPHVSLNLSSRNAILHSLPKTSLVLPSSPSSLTILAMKKIQGRVVKDANNKTVAVEVVRLAPHPKYKRRIRIKKRYQAHDPENVFKVGDYVELEKIRPISKTKTFLAVAVAVAAKNRPKAVDPVPQELRELPPLQSQEQA